MPLGAWGEWRCTYAHGPASDGPRLSGIPFAGPVRGRSHPVAAGSGRKWPSVAVWVRKRHGTCSPIWNGIGSGKALTLILLIVGHQATGGGFYSGNGRTSSSLTGLTSGLPISVSGCLPNLSESRRRFVDRVMLRFPESAVSIA